MDVRQLRALLAVADYGTFSAAADMLGTVQSNVSAHVARLEKELSTTLVDRTQGNLTEQGTAVARRARRIIAEMESLHADVAAVRNEVLGNVSLGIIGTTARWLAPLLLEAARTQHPLVRIMVSDSNTSTLERQLISGDLDLGVVLLPTTQAEVAYDPLFEEDQLLVVPSNHPFADHTELSMETLSEEALILPALGSPARTEIDRLASEEGVALRAKAEVEGLRLTASLVFDGFAPAILPATALPNYLPAGSWKLIPVLGLPRRRIGVVYHRRSYPSAPARAIRTLLGEVCRDAVSRHPGLHSIGGTSS